MAVTYIKRIKLRRGTAAQWTSENPTLLQGEIGIETDLNNIIIGNGVTSWNSSEYYGIRNITLPTNDYLFRDGLKFGFGTNSPSASVEISASITDVSNPIFKVTDSSTSGDGYMSIIDGTSAANQFNPIFMSRGSGTGAGRFGLLIVGDMEDDTADDFSIGLRGQVRSAASVAATVFRVENYTTTIMSMDSNGYLYIQNLRGATGGSDARYNPTTKELFYDTSAKKYKENIKDLNDDDTSWIYEIPVTKYDRKNKTKKDEIGIIADDLAKIRPDFCAYNEKDEVESYSKGDLVPPILHELQKLKKEVELLKKK